MATLSEKLEALSKPGSLFEPVKDGAVRCLACAHRCLIKPGARGICQMRLNRDGQLMVPWGYVAGAAVDPIEKKPFMHFLPGAKALTFGMLGCNFHCDFCQNWVSSQALRDPASASSGNYIQLATPEELVQSAKEAGAEIIASSYNEPLITTEWAVDIFTCARREGLRCVYVSNGFATSEVVHSLKPVLDGYKVDLKCMTDEKYRSLGGRLQVVLDTIKLAHELGMWVEVVTLVIPNFNDSNEELWEMARALLAISADIPWHVTAFYPTYKHLGAERTSAEILQRAADIGQEAGLRFVYAGNLPGRVGPLENTFCPKCSQPLVRRSGYFVRENRITKEGTCPNCGEKIAGVWH
ncbi:MAG: AmmeMemoRadiSam system radical SAM enzyme [Anaerolineaceae bacterium]|nr:AmmeMemoRadiSam system radical SAM enzyme [Anaerolineaceae bacterium]